MCGLPGEEEAGVKVFKGARLRFANERGTYRVRCISERYAICTRPHNPLRTVIYSIIDIDRGIPDVIEVCFRYSLGVFCLEVVSTDETITSPINAEMAERLGVNKHDMGNILRSVTFEALLNARERWYNVVRARRKALDLRQETLPWSIEGQDPGLGMQIEIERMQARLSQPPE